MNTTKHAVGDSVYVQTYQWPSAVTLYTVKGIKTETGKPDIYILETSQGPERSVWAYATFDNFIDAFKYKYLEQYHPSYDGYNSW